MSWEKIISINIYYLSCSPCFKGYCFCELRLTGADPNTVKVQGSQQGVSRTGHTITGGGGGKGGDFPLLKFWEKVSLEKFIVFLQRIFSLEKFFAFSQQILFGKKYFPPRSQKQTKALPLACMNTRFQVLADGD